jgi:hypothetical protein
MVRETKIENDTRASAHVELGIESIKLNLSGNRGWPDTLFLFDGHVFFIEFKRPGEEATELQLFRINWLKDNGFPAMVCDNVNEAMEALQRWKLLIVGKNSPRLPWKPMT